MVIVGRWLRCDDGITRPIFEIGVHGQAGLCNARYCSVLSAALFHELQLPEAPPGTDFRLLGISGHASFVMVQTALQFTSSDGNPVRVRGEFAAFTDPSASDMNVLGRDVLNNFDLFLSRRRGEALLLAPPHAYLVSS
jgi:hypothetical protein